MKAFLLLILVPTFISVQTHAWPKRIPNPEASISGLKKGTVVLLKNKFVVDQLVISQHVTHWDGSRPESRNYFPRIRFFDERGPHAGSNLPETPYCRLSFKVLPEGMEDEVAYTVPAGTALTISDKVLFRKLFNDHHIYFNTSYKYLGQDQYATALLHCRQVSNYGEFLKILGTSFEVQLPN